MKQGATGLYPGLTREALLARERALRAYDAWCSKLPSAIGPSEAISAVTGLYEFLPPASRERPVDPSGVITFHAALSKIATR